MWEKGRGGGKKSGVFHTRGVSLVAKGIHRLWLQHGMKLYLPLEENTMRKKPQEVAFSHIQAATIRGVSNGGGGMAGQHKTKVRH